jgi:drug/metabolite transporter (DMT)-like permease
MTVAMILIGSYLVASKIILNTTPLFFASFARQFLALLALCTYVAVTRQPIPKLTRRDKLLLCFQAFVGVFLYSIFTLIGVRNTTSINANVIMSTTPIAMTAIAVIFLHEQITWRRTTGILLALAGTVLINVMGKSHTVMDASGSTVFGNVLIVLAVLAEGVFLTFGKMQAKPLPAVWLSLFLTLIGSLLFSPLAALDIVHTGLSRISGLAWILLLYTGVAVTGLAVVLMNSGMEHVPTTSASIFTALMPISGVALSIMVLHESFHWYHALGGILVGAAVVSVLFEKNTQPTRTAAPPHTMLEAAD